MPRGRGTHPTAFRDLTGKVFANWTVVKRGTEKTFRVHWLCRCVCGTFQEVSGAHLSGGRSKSCGCVRPVKERTIRSHPLSSSYANIIQRCENPNNAYYKNYGGRGISMHPVWRTDFWKFVEDMGEKPSPAHSIERLDNSRGYEPGNCVWATSQQQMRNTRRNNMVFYAGRTMPLVEACEISGVNYGTAKWRLRNGVPMEDAFK